MRVINVRNVHRALPVGLYLLDGEGVWMNSRNDDFLGRARVYPVPVATVYHRPWERVIFWDQRDANPFLHLYESLWMLAGRNDLAPLLRYSSTFTNFSDDGDVLHGAYGHRWRNMYSPTDQLDDIATLLHANQRDRRAVLQMWDANFDLGSSSKDVPCNTMATFQVTFEGKLNLVVFCRSNDIIWGAYGANAVHFSFLLEYMAARIGVPMGTYTQVSVNYHAYEKTLEQMSRMPRSGAPDTVYDPYMAGETYHQPMWLNSSGTSDSLYPSTVGAILDQQINELLTLADHGFHRPYQGPFTQWTDMVYAVLYAHHLYKTLDGEEKFTAPLDLLYKRNIHRCDFALAAMEWIERRQQKAKAKS